MSVSAARIADGIVGAIAGLEVLREIIAKAAADHGSDQTLTLAELDHLIGVAIQVTREGTAQ